MKAKKENKFFVLKQDELERFFEQFYPHVDAKFLDEEGTKLSNALDKIVKGIGDMREAEGKPRFNKYICCNQDEPYAEKVWQIILKGEDIKSEFKG